MNPAPPAVSRPLRAVTIVIGSWIALRGAALWPVVSAPVAPTLAARVLAPHVSPILQADDFRLRDPVPPPLRVSGAMERHQSLAHHVHPLWRSAVLPTGRSIETRMNAESDGARARTAASPSPSPGNAQRTQATAAFGRIHHADATRLTGSAWALMRDGGAAALASGGQLGGSQAGIRLYYTPGPRALALTARLSAPLGQPLGREGAVGIALRGRNVGLIVEQRFGLDRGTRDTSAATLYGGVSEVALPGGLRLDGYAQAGIVSIGSPAAFADGAVRVEHRLVAAGRTTLSIGAGAWGGAQPGVARLDIGPQAVARVAVAAVGLRVSAEWRQRVAGNAAPASGPAVTLGFDF